MRYLPDVNILIALVDHTHVHREIAIRWHESVIGHEILVCPITECDVVRVVSNPKYPSGPIMSSEVIFALKSLYKIGIWGFIPDDISIKDDGIYKAQLIQSKHLTDIYLLGLCARHGITLATMDRTITTQGLTKTPKDLICFV